MGNSAAKPPADHQPAADRPPAPARFRLKCGELRPDMLTLIGRVARERPIASVTVDCTAEYDDSKIEALSGALGGPPGECPRGSPGGCRGGYRKLVLIF